MLGQKMLLKTSNLQNSFIAVVKNSEIKVVVIRLAYIRGAK